MKYNFKIHGDQKILVELMGELRNRTCYNFELHAESKYLLVTVAKEFSVFIFENYLPKYCIVDTNQEWQLRERFLELCSHGMRSIVMLTK